MDAQTDERLLRDIEGCLIELVRNVERNDEASLIAEVLVSVQDALRDPAQKPICRPDSNRETLALPEFADSIIEISASGSRIVGLL
jgi:hypothetical protein